MKALVHTNSAAASKNDSDIIIALAIDGVLINTRSILFGLDELEVKGEREAVAESK